jgi:DNA-binding HxlR family transcriptional regulator
MEENKKTDECKKAQLAIMDTLDVFSGKWKIPIVGALLYFKKLRYAELEKILDKISPRMLSKELKDLETHKLIEREVVNTKPVSVYYKITAYGETASNFFLEMAKWGENHRKEMFG